MRLKEFNILSNYGAAEKTLAVGFFVLLTGMFWVGSRSNYHQAYYFIFALPALSTFFFAKHQCLELFQTKSFLLYLFLAGYMLLSVAWSDTNTAFFSLLKRPLYIALLFVGVFVLIRKDRDHFESLLMLCLYGGTLAALYFLAHHFLYAQGGRLTGHGALHNPLLTAHVFGMYAAFTLAILTSRQQHKLLLAGMLAIFVALLLMTGSRTPIVGLVAASAWLAFTKADKRTVAVMALVGLCLTTLVAIKPEILMARGLSYRPEIWHQALIQISERPFFGYGFDNNSRFFVAELNTSFHDPHNFFLGVLHAGGVVGLILWGALMATLLVAGWKMRSDWLALAASTALVFGLASSLTEGDSFLSRPKEHWFLIWIPFSILIGMIAKNQAEARRFVTLYRKD